ncbi:hypothetical protein [Nocardia macrotermitis]|uniref:Uncharacterized protein n=1 Tax=Nocardia macrotermitis TaxID=2585198 RepID=A0A7K0D8W7_9NOCA|nr:hypothetical protein [Nocardia macrotermitis]MQY22225.1 hypothetical protein [Nocardia macrotermitis]
MSRSVSQRRYNVAFDALARPRDCLERQRVETDLAHRFRHGDSSPTTTEPRRRVPAHRDFDCPGTALIV